MENNSKKRGRPLGSKNKVKLSSGNSVSLIKLEKQIEGSPITKSSPFGWVNWGQKNNYPELLLNLYNQSPTHRACINFGVQSIFGNGVDYAKMQLNGDEVAPNPYQTWDEIIKNIALDFMLYGSYAIQIILNKDGKTFSFFHMPIDKVRWPEYDEEGNINYYWICSDWSSTSTNKPFIIDAFNKENRIEKGKPYLYVHRQYSPALQYYTQPHYQAGIKAIQAEIEYVNYDLRTTVNGFTPSGMLVLNEVETDEQRQGIIDNVQRLFQGSDNANSVMITFRSNVDENKPEFVPFVANSGNINLFDSANQRTVSRILASHQIPNASLVGMPDIGNTGFASEADKLETAYQLYNKLTGNANRMSVIKTLNMMLQMNGVDTEIVMKPLSFNDFGDDANVEERTTVENNELNVEENNNE